MKHDLRCLLCKMQIHCKSGDLANMRNHLKVRFCLKSFFLDLSKFLIIFPLQVEHEMVRYEVELMLHLCFISKEEHDTIIKILTFRFANMHVSWLTFVTTCMQAGPVCEGRDDRKPS